MIAATFVMTIGIHFHVLTRQHCLLIAFLVRLPYQLLIKDDEARREADSKGMNLVVTLVLLALVVIGLILEGI